MLTAEHYISIIAAASALILSALQAASTIRRAKAQNTVDRADSAVKIGDAYDKLLDNLQEQLTMLQNQFNKLQHENASLKIELQDVKKELRKNNNWNARLAKQIIDLGGTPIDPPTTGDLIP